ncbi:metal ABC transporter permease [Szabonella alba]|uniref:Metal ABC transporter permease n=1 Tax=Szabonella alba TaxID=2804194 RepID=A0A8K0Y002_9RHOB|nr:metal ABC transporter permease [Szabonella alba]MBL4916322.1 metal ABC transporter permease [Szabonella alba]
MLIDALFLQAGYNATLVTLGAAALGAAAGAVGSFLILRRRALVPDAMAHATLPGLGIAFLIMATFGGEGRYLPGLLLGAGLSALAGLWILQTLASRTRLPEDAAIGTVLSVSYGAGIVVLTLVQGLGLGRPAGLESFLLGQASGMLAADAQLIAGGAGLALVLLVLLRRAFVMVAFDPLHARVAGIDTGRVDLALMALVLGVVLLGLRVVGAILIVALLITPAAAARMWTDRAGIMALIAAGIGAGAGYGGAALSASFPGLPTGPVIVLLAFAAFLVSLLFGSARGVLRRGGNGGVA